MMSSMVNVLVFLAAVLHMAAAGFELATDGVTIRDEDRDPFKMGYFNMVVGCFALMFFFLACMIGVRVCLGKRRGNTTQSFFLVA